MALITHCGELSTGKSRYEDIHFRTIGTRARVTAALRFSIAAAFVAAAFSQPRPVAAFSPIPLLPPGFAVTTDGLPHAFLDVRNRQVVVEIAEPLSTLRFDVPNGVSPALAYQVSPEGGQSGGLIDYSFTLNDAADSPQRSYKFSLLLPSHDSGLSVQSSPWELSLEETSLPDRTATQSMGTMRYVSWQDRSRSQAKVFALRFQASSSYLPGFVDAYVQGLVANPISATAVAAAPTSIRGDLLRTLDPAFSSYHQLVFGPLFRPDAPKTVIAANFHFALQFLVGHGQLNGASAYTQGLLQSLEGFLESGGEGFLDVSALAPASALERTVQGAVVLALSPGRAVAAPLPIAVGRDIK